MYFKDRADAGRRLADVLHGFEDKGVVFAIPRGGVIVGKQISTSLKLPLYLTVVRKISDPYSSELAIGAVAADGHRILDTRAVKNIDRNWLLHEISLQRHEAKRRERLYIGNEKQPTVEGKTAILVDDGVATGYTILVALKELKHYLPNEIVVAIPVCSHETVLAIRETGCKVIALENPVELIAISLYYQSFPQISDEDVVSILRSH